MKDIFLFGDGGHAKVVIDAINTLGEYRVVGIFDANIKNENVLDKQENISNYMHITDMGIIAFGDIAARAKLYNNLKNLKFKLVNVKHSTSIIATTVNIGCGNFFSAGCIVNASAVIGDNCIINTGSIIEHDCVLGNNIHMAPKSVICGNVKIGSNTFIGSNSTIVPNINIGENVVIGAGAVVLEDIPDGKKVVGVPAK